MGSAHLFPRAIDPSLIEIGDTIKVTHKKSHGMQMSMTGTVAKRDDHGATRYYMTEEGGTLLAWNVKRKDVHILLLHREEASQTAMFSFNEWEERLTG